MSVFLAASLSAAVLPHPTRAGRLVDERDGFRVEYSPGQEAYAAAVFAPLAAWQLEFAEKEAQVLATEPVVLPGSAKDLTAHREEILAAVAKEIGLAAPTALQGRVFDTMVNYYTTVEGLKDYSLPLAALMTGRCRAVQIWTEKELTARLGAGEKIEGFSWNPETEEGEFSYKTEFKLPVDQKEEARKFEAARLDHSFNYRPGEGGVVNFEASFTIDKSGRPQPLQPPEWVVRWDLVASTALKNLDDISWPIFLKEEEGAQVPDTVARESVAVLRSSVQRAQKPDGQGYRNPVLLHTVLHEVAEVGLVENCIGSADCRWLCDGVANYVAWKIVRDRCGAEVARQAYNLDGLLARHVALQKQVDLRNWRAAENTKEEENDMPLMKARYAFATRAVFEMVRRNDESLLPRLFQEVAKTPRKKVRMETVEKAYRKLTGKKLGEVLKYAETAPVPVAAK